VQGSRQGGVHATLKLWAPMCAFIRWCNHIAVVPPSDACHSVRVSLRFPWGYVMPDLLLKPAILTYCTLLYFMPSRAVCSPPGQARHCIPQPQRAEVGGQHQPPLTCPGCQAGGAGCCCGGRSRGTGECAGCVCALAQDLGTLVQLLLGK
jgi:hypothetical protein